jgi:hypothetical protein
MSTIALSLPLPVALSAVNATVGSRRDDSVRSAIQSILAGNQQERKTFERRRETRFPYPHPVHITPLDDDDQPRQGETIVVLGKQLSEHGLDFFHRLPIADRRVIASLPSGQNGWIGLRLELTWCRFNRHGWYDNGGRFLGLVDSPLAS